MAKTKCNCLPFPSMSHIFSFLRGIKSIFMCCLCCHFAHQLFNVWFNIWNQSTTLFWLVQGLVYKTDIKVTLVLKNSFLYILNKKKSQWINSIKLANVITSPTGTGENVMIFKEEPKPSPNAQIYVLKVTFAEQSICPKLGQYRVFITVPLSSGIEPFMSAFTDTWFSSVSSPFFWASSFQTSGM